jgi:guanylate kinase
VVSAPSGTGKTTVCRAVVSRDPEIVFSVSHTTRAPRAGERDGVDYHFVSRQEFLRLVEADAFLEHAEYRAQLYGTSWAALETPLRAGRDVLLEIEVQGARQVRLRRPDARFVFLLPPSLEILEQRLRGRGTESEELIARRLAVARQELGEVQRYDYVVVNDELERAIESLLRIVHAERAGRGAELRDSLGREATLRRVGPALGLGPGASGPPNRPPAAG